MDPSLIVVPIALIAGLGLALAAFVPKEQPTTPPDSYPKVPPQLGPTSRIAIATFTVTVEEFIHEYLQDTTYTDPHGRPVNASEMIDTFYQFVSDKFMLENFGEDGLH